MPGARLELREARPDDLDPVVDLLRRRDGRPHGRQGVSDALFALRPDRLRAWIAWVDGDPAALTTLYLRDLRWPGGEKRAGYWAHLFVDERYRRLMLYPQLVAAMLRGARELGLEVLYTFTRRAHVARSHTKLGFELVGVRPVLARPLRPVRLLARHKGLGAPLETLGAPLDRLYGALSTRRRGPEGEGAESVIAGREVDAGRVSRALNALAEGRISQVWAPDRVAGRLRGTIDGCRYSLLAGTGADLIYRTAERGNAIRAGVLMQLLRDPGHPNPATPALLRTLSRRLSRADADVVLTLEPEGPADRRTLRQEGFRPVSERYHLLVWPKALVSGPPAASLESWHFSFLDHDAF